MDINKISRAEKPPLYGVTSSSGGGTAGERFRDQMGQSLKDNLKKRAQELFDDLKETAQCLETPVNLDTFERCRLLIKELLSDILQNAYTLQTEQVTDANGRQRLFETVTVIDQKLSTLASDLFVETGDKLDILSRVDDIRGLVMDLLL
ncbi:YaaR family protein [Oscillospiraceae bacterium CM]|nr:YaaR family protein [Oscillospiraceae bacterium CM]